jgi:hypothetical protein
MKFYLKHDGNNYWVITSEKGNVISGPKHYMKKDQAFDWARSFISSWRGAELITEEK